MPVPTCPATGDLVEAEIHRVGTQYRESPNLLGLMRGYLRQIEEVAQAVCAIPSFFDIDTAVGDQLTLLGKRLGWPRCHCVCDVAPVFGFACEGQVPGGPPIVGFCEGGTWVDCDEVGNSEICLDDDEVYRGYLKARRYQMLGLYDVASLQAAAQHVWGSAASVAEAGRGRVVLAPGRALSTAEAREMPLVIRVMPIAPGIRATVHLDPGPIFGFGTGWGGLCEGASWLCETDPRAYSCEDTGLIFGFCDGFGGFCAGAEWAC